MHFEGYILGANNAPVAATVTLVDHATGSVSFRQIAPGQKYTLDIDETAPGVGDLVLVFSSPGYTSKQITVAQLQAGPADIHLHKVNTWLLILIAAGLFYALYDKRKKVGAVTTQEIMPLILIVGAFLGINAISKLLDKLGLGGNPTTSEIADPDSPWKPGYWRKFTTFRYAINEQQAKEYSQTIHSAFTVISDDFNQVMGVFNQMRTKANVSFLSDIFTRQYNEDLLSFLTDGGGVLPWDGLSKEHLQQILTYVQNLPSN